MNHFIIASHGELARGMKNSILFFNPQVSVDVIEQTIIESGFKEKAITILEKNKSKNIVVFTDLFGGSVNQIFMSLLTKYDFYLITNMNLGIILEFVFMEEIITPQLIRDKTSNIQNNLYFMNDFIAQMNNNEED